jgi:hypothetical protein
VCATWPEAVARIRARAADFAAAAAAAAALAPTAAAEEPPPWDGRARLPVASLLFAVSLLLSSAASGTYRRAVVTRRPLYAGPPALAESKIVFPATRSRSSFTFIRRCCNFSLQGLSLLGFRSDNKKERGSSNTTEASSSVEPSTMNGGQFQGNGLPQQSQNEKRFLNPVDPAVAQAVALQAAREQVQNGTVVIFFFLNQYNAKL